MIDPNAQFKTMDTDGAARTGFPCATEWTVPDSMPYLDGHFPGLPVLPAVGIVDATVHLLRGVLKKPHAYLTKVDAAKFLVLIGPAKTVRIELKEIGASEWQADWKESDTQKLLATLRVGLGGV